MWDLPGPGLKPVSPALAGGFLTTAPPGKSLARHLYPRWVPSAPSSLLYHAVQVAGSLYHSLNLPQRLLFLWQPSDPQVNKFEEFFLSVLSTALKPKAFQQVLCCFRMWMKNIACHINKQKMLQPSTHHFTAALMVSPEGTQDGNRLPAI